MAKNTVQSIEPNIADLVNGWLKSYKVDYKLEQESLNTEIDQALNDYFSKNGGAGGNRPDAKLLLQDKALNYYPILIEYKGYKDKLVKLDSNGQVDNKTAKNEPNYKNINSYAVNGAVHYANAILHHTSYTDIIAIGVTGYKDESGKLIHKIGVYYVSKSNFGIGQKVEEFCDKFSPVEETLCIFEDLRTKALYCECHIYAENIISLGTIDSPLDSENQSEYRANRDVVEDNTAFLQMKEDAKQKRSFSNIVAEYITTFDEEHPLKIIGGQHRFIL